MTMNHLVSETTDPNSINAFLETVPRFDSLIEAINSLSSTVIDSIDDVNLKPVSGGDINDSGLLTLDSVDPEHRQIFLKQNSVDNARLLSAEVAGLVAIRATGARTCQPLCFGIDNELGCSFLLLSVIHSSQGSKGATNKSQGWHDLASQLATLHQALPPQPDSVEAKATNPDTEAQQQTEQQIQTWYAGWFEDNFIGSNPQYNPWSADWHEFFATQRLGQQTKMAFDKQLINRQTVQQIERIQHKLQQYLPDYPLTDNTGQPRPSLLHGDLWAGNAMLGNTSANSSEVLGYLIDPAVYVGHPETDLAMTQLFGGFSKEFYDAYAGYGLVEEGFTDRLDVYNLYHYLNHLNLFGSGYLSAVQRIANRFGS
ncbi:Fructosamine-3-kinase [Psychrobacter phenylpyruvicus]|uniref:Fructosamine-3-kinase n=2 Tax=Psychrobacter phenylpyruvicus TaxID=29432 RepID=A0A379LN54_9GAMM|nr:Fructosamine-3-kinase [Psychrobacter phenylpyruvicus]